MYCYSFRQNNHDNKIFQVAMKTRSPKSKNIFLISLDFSLLVTLTMLATCKEPTPVAKYTKLLIEKQGTNIARLVNKKISTCSSALEIMEQKLLSTMNSITTLQIQEGILNVKKKSLDQSLLNLPSNSCIFSGNIFYIM